MERLINIGFKKAGKWELVNNTAVDFDLNESSSHKNVLYAFISGSKILYIGKSKRTLKERMANYKNADPSQSTNVKVKGKIIELLNKKLPVDIYVFSDSGLLKYGPFAISLSAGLEDSLIEAIKPELNDFEAA